jgi:hypothetical protein
MAISNAIPASIAQVMNSATHSNGYHWPISGNTNSASNSCPYAVTSVKKSSPNPTKTNQWAAPTALHLSIRVCPSVSRNIVVSRRPSRSVRSWTGWPSRMTRTICDTALAARAIATSVMATETTTAAGCIPVQLPSLVRTSTSSA